MFTFKPIEPGVSYEYAVGTIDHARIGRVRKEEAASWPHHPTGRWIADDGTIQKSGFATRQAAAEWLGSWVSTHHGR